MYAGAILEINRYWDESAGEELCRIWFCSTLLSPIYAQNTENCVCAVVRESMPVVGEYIWIDEGRVYFNHMRRHLETVGAPYPAPVAEEW